MEPGESGENRIRLEVPLIPVAPEETPIGPGLNSLSLGADSEAVSVSMDVANPTSTGERDVHLPPSLQPMISPMQLPDGPTELPKPKKRRVMFADE